MQYQHANIFTSDLALNQRALRDGLELVDNFFRHLKVTFLFDCEFRLETQSVEVVWVHREHFINCLIRGVEVAQHFVIDRQILQRPGVFWIEADRLFQTRVRFIPFPLPPLDRSHSKINFRFVR